MSTDVIDWLGKTALHQAAKSNEPNIVKRLLQANAEISKQDGFGNTPLHAAAIYNSPEAARLLVNEGADINLKNEQCETPLDKARDDSEVKRLLLKLQQNAL